MSINVIVVIAALVNAVIQALQGDVDSAVGWLTLAGVFVLIEEATS